MVFGLIVLYMNWGPIYSQLLRRPSRAAMTWTMFHGIGSDVCVAEFTERRGGETSVISDRLRRLGLGSPDDAPQEARLIESPEQAIKQGIAICLGSHASDIRVRLRCGHDGGWIERLHGDTNVCRDLSPVATNGGTATR
jgi:hypothetical protein